MKKLTLTFSLVVFSFCCAFSQDNLTDYLKYSIGETLPSIEKIDYISEDGNTKSTKKTKIRGPFFNKVEYYTDKNNIIKRVKVYGVNKKKAIDFLEKKSELDYESTSKYFDLKIYSSPEYQYTLDLKDKDLSIESVDYPFDIIEDKFNKTKSYISFRNQNYSKDKFYSYPSFEFKFSFDKGIKDNLFCTITFYSTKWLFGESIRFLLQNNEVLSFDLKEISRDVSDYNSSIKERYFITINRNEARKLIDSKKTKIRISGEGKHVELPMISSYRYAINDIMNSTIFNKE